MIIIVEGIDRVGKTTFCNMLKDQLGIKTYKKDREHSNGDKTLSSAISNYGNAMGHVGFWSSDICKDLTFTVDRFHWTEKVYNMLLRGVPSNMMDVVDKRLAKMPNVLMVLVKPTNIEWSSKKHGTNLEAYDAMFNSLYDEYKGHKMTTNFNHLQEAVDYIYKVYIKGCFDGQKQ